VKSNLRHEDDPVEGEDLFPEPELDDLKSRNDPRFLHPMLRQPDEGLLTKDGKPLTFKQKSKLDWLSGFHCLFISSIQAKSRPLEWN
jgi:hypothetical protein